MGDQEEYSINLTKSGYILNVVYMHSTGTIISIVGNNCTTPIYKVDYGGYLPPAEAQKMLFEALDAIFTHLTDRSHTPM